MKGKLTKFKREMANPTHLKIFNTATQELLERETHKVDRYTYEHTVKHLI